MSALGLSQATKINIRVAANNINPLALFLHTDANKKTAFSA